MNKPEIDWREKSYTADQNSFHLRFGAGVIIVVLLMLVGIGVFEDTTGYSMNVYTEIISIGVTIFILDLRAEWREDRRRERELRERLIREAGSRSNETSKAAIDELWHRGWVTGEDSLLVGAHLKWANMTGCYLSDTNLQRAYLKYADLTGARLHRTDLRGAILERAELDEADIQKANLAGADVRSADFTGANLTGAIWYQVKADENTILPDGTNWTPQTDLTRFGCITKPSEVT